MGKDIPDWGGNYNNSAFYPLFDHGELAVRLGSPVAYDRRGSVVWYNNFLYGLDEMSSEGYNSTPNVDLVVSGNSQSPFAARIQGTANATSRVRWYKQFDIPNADRHGFFILSRLNDPFTKHGLLVYFADGTDLYRAEVKLPGTDSNSVDLLHSGGTATLAIVSEYGAVTTHQVPIKLVIDTATAKYERLIIGGQELDVSDYSLVDDGASSARYFDFCATAYGTATHGPNSIVDLMIFSTNEPTNT